MKTATLTGIVSVDTMVWPDGGMAPPVVRLFYSPDNATGPPFASFTSANAMTVDCYRDAATQNHGFSGDFNIRMQTGDPLDTTWEGNFSHGDTVFYNRTAGGAAGENDDQISIRFGAAVQGVGCQIMRFTPGTGWTAEMRAYDAVTGGTLLHTVTRTDGSGCQATTGPCPENSAIFLGIAADAADPAAIRRVEINVRNTANGVEDAFAINFLTFGAFDPLAVEVSGGGVAGLPASCGPALIPGACMPVCPEDALPRAALVPTAATVVAGVGTAALAECGHPIMGNPCVEECEV